MVGAQPDSLVDGTKQTDATIPLAAEELPQMKFCLVLHKLSVIVAMAFQLGRRFALEESPPANAVDHSHN
jgi:hypothetical protein